MKRLKFRNIAIIEGIVLAAALVVFRLFIFRLLNGQNMLHVSIAVHAFMIGATLTLFCAFALTVKRAWKTHGKFMLLPVMFTVFGLLLQAMAYDVDF